MTIEAKTVYSALDEMAAQCSLLAERFPDLMLIAVERGGVPVAQYISEKTNIAIAGKLNINFYRDDFSQNGLHPVVKASELPGSLEGCDIVLVDDVLHTGRTVRAALNELFDFGRPNRVILAVLASREQGRELPFQADIIGLKLAVDEHQKLAFDPEAYTIDIIEQQAED